MIEREKRWELKGEIPTDKIKEKFNISQSYANISPDVRVRCITYDNSTQIFSHCVKYVLPQDSEREEVEQKISKERYERILSTINKKPVIKDRTVVELSDGLFAEVDDFKDVNKVIIEVEFPTEESMNVFEIPDWFGKEIVKDKSFSVEVFEKINSSNLWKKI